MTKDKTAIAIIRLALDNNVPLAKLAGFVEQLIDVAFINSQFQDGMFRAKTMVEAFNIISDQFGHQ